MIRGAGNSTINNYYSFIDDQPKGEVSYYRLVQVDHDLKETIYGPIAVQNCRADILTISVVSDGTIPTLFIDSKEYKVLQIVIFDTNGKQLSNTNLNKEPGLSTLKLSMEDPASGIYYVRVLSDQEFVTKKFYIK